MFKNHHNITENTRKKKREIRENEGEKNFSTLPNLRINRHLTLGFHKE